MIYILTVRGDEAALRTEPTQLSSVKERNVKLGSKLETLLVMGVKTAGSYDPVSALGTIEEGMTLQEAVTAAKFLNWVVANKLTFGRGNIRERFRQFDTAH